MLLLIRDSSLIIVRFVHCYIRDTIQRFIIPRSQRNNFSKTLWHSVKRWTYHSFLSYHRQARLMSNTGWWWMLFLASVLKGMHGHHLEMPYQSWRMLTFLFAQWTSLQVNNNNNNDYYRIIMNCRYHIHKVVLRQPDSWSNWNLEMLVFEERENRSTRRKTSRSKGENQQQTQPTLVWRRPRDLNLGHIGGRRALSPLCHPWGKRSHHCAIPCSPG